jgi:hypothetical protein
MTTWTLLAANKQPSVIAGLFGHAARLVKPQVNLELSSGKPFQLASAMQRNDSFPLVHRSAVNWVKGFGDGRKASEVVNGFLYEHAADCITC